MPIVSNPYGATLAAIVPPVMPTIEWSGPLFAIKREGWEISLPPNMIMPPAPVQRGVAQLFADGGALSGKRAVSPAFVTAGADENAGDAAKPRFPSPQDAVRYVDYGWKLYWTPQDEGIRDGIIREIRGVAEPDIDRLVGSWQRQEPYSYLAVFLFALAGHKYARKKFVEFTLKKIPRKAARPQRGFSPPDVKDIAGAILDNILPKTQALCNETNENVRTDLFCMIRGLVLTLCELASRGDKNAMESVSKYFNILSQADSQLSKMPKDDGRFARVRASLKSLRDEAVYLLSEVDPGKFLDDPVRNRGELDYLAGRGNRQVLETYAQYAARGDFRAALIVLNTSIELRMSSVFDLLMEAAKKNPCLLPAILYHPESSYYKLSTNTIRYLIGLSQEMPPPKRKMIVHIEQQLQGFDLTGVSCSCGNSGHLDELILAMALMGNASAIARAVQSTERSIAEGKEFADDASLKSAPLNHLIKAKAEGDPNADALIKNLARLGHKEAQRLAVGRAADKMAN